MIAVIQKEFDGDIDKFCLEIAYLFVRLSTIGVHILPPGFPVNSIDVPQIKNGLIVHDLKNVSTLALVDILYSTQKKKTHTYFFVTSQIRVLGVMKREEKLPPLPQLIF